MFIAEVLLLLRDLNSAATDLSRKIDENIFVLPTSDDSNPSLNVDKLLGDYERILKKINYYKNSLMNANVSNLVMRPEGEDIPVVNLIRAIDFWRKREKIYREIVAKARDKNGRYHSPTGAFYSTSSIELKFNLEQPTTYYEELADVCKNEARECDKLLTKSNWTYTIDEYPGEED